MEDLEGLDYEDADVVSASHEMAQPNTSCAFVYRIAPSTNTLTVGCAVATPRRRTTEADSKAYQLSLYQFEDVEFANLESLLVRLSPSVCHHPELGGDDAEVVGPNKEEDGKPANAATKKQVNALEKTLKHKLVSTLDVLGIEGKAHKVKSAFNVSDVTSDLNVLVGEADMIPYALLVSSPEWKLALQATSLLCRKEGFPSRDPFHGAFTIEFESLNSYMRLDSAAITALNLLPGKEDKNKDFSVLGVLDKTVTKRLGTRLLTKWIRHPLVDVTRITSRQDRVEVLFEDTETREALRSALRSVPDLDLVAKRFTTGKGGLEDLYVLYRFTDLIPAIIKAVESLVESATAKGSNAFSQELERLKELDGSGRFGQYREFVEDVIDLDRAPREFLVRAKHDETGELESLARERGEIDDDMDRVVKRVLSGELSGLDARFEQDYRMIKTHGHHFRVPKKHDAQLSTVKSGRTLLVVQACIRWTTPQLEDLSSRRGDVVQKQGRVQAKYVREAMQVAASYLPLIEMSASVVSDLDAFASLAHVAATCPQGDYSRPSMSSKGEGDLFFPSARHPCLELQPDTNFVPNTHKMTRVASRFQILTGPNMGGKSTYARQLGVMCVLAQIGSFVPCAKGATAPVMDSILARVGASDAQLRGISTFMAEMIEASNIIKTCTDSSLVIIDELGRGTSTYDGFGLAWAISEHLATKTNCFAIFATHFHELTELAKSVEGVCNMHVAAVVEADGRVVMLHEVREGKCNDSFGVNIAKVAGFPSEVIEDANQLLQRMDKFRGFEGIGIDDSNAEDVVSPTDREEDATLRKKLKTLVEIAQNAASDDAAFVSKMQEVLSS